KMIRRRLCRRGTLQCCAVDDKDVGPTIVVVVENRNPRAGGLDDVVLCVDPAENVCHRQAGFSGDILKICKTFRGLLCIPHRNGYQQDADELRSRFRCYQAEPHLIAKYYKVARLRGAGNTGVVRSGMLECKINLRAWVLMMAAVSAPLQPQSKPAHSTAETLYAQGMAALRKQDLNAARSSFEKLIEVAPRSPEAHNSLGWVFLNQGQIDPAIAQFRTAIGIKTGFPQAHLNLANALS